MGLHIEVEARHCTGAQRCVELAAELFTIRADARSQPVHSEVAEDRERAEGAARECPTLAISVTTASSPRR